MYGERDAVDGDGKPVYQQVDYPSLVPLLFAALVASVGPHRRPRGRSMTDVFGDIEPADLWDADPTIDPLQVAIRLHDLRPTVDILVGHDDLAPWHDLTEADGTGSGVGRIIADLIAEREPDNPAVLARLVHEDTVVGNWDDLPPTNNRSPST